MFYFYVLENEENELYFGATKDLRRRLKQHQRGRSEATQNHSWILVYYEAYRNEEDARTRETRIKMHGQAKRQLKDRIRRSRREQS